MINIAPPPPSSTVPHCPPVYVHSFITAGQKAPSETPEPRAKTGFLFKGLLFFTDFFCLVYIMDQSVPSARGRGLRGSGGP